MSEDHPSKGPIRVVLSDDELQLPAIDDLCNKYFDWLNLSKEAAGGRKTRAANRRVDTIYDEIMAFKLPPIKLESMPSAVASPPPPLRVNPNQTNGNANVHLNSTKTSVDGDSEGSSVASSGPSTGGRTLRPRCRTPSVSRKQATAPSTPTHQSIRAHMKKNLDSSSSNVISAGVIQEHPPVSLTKIRQLLRADSAQKKREEERERQEKARVERKAKEEKAEAQKRKMLEERAQTAKMNREQRLQHAAEVRKAREKAKVERKLKEPVVPVGKYQQVKPVDQTQQIDTTQKSHNVEPTAKVAVATAKVAVAAAKPTKQAKQPPVDVPTQAPVNPKQEQPSSETQNHKESQEQRQQEQPPQEQSKPRKLDETFQKPATDNDNIDISIHDETSDEPSKRANQVAAWAKAPFFREAVVGQFSKKEPELQRMVIEIFGSVKLPVDLDEIFESHKLLTTNRRYLVRTSSAVWTTPHRPPKRSNTEVTTPSDPSKRTKDYS